MADGRPGGRPPGRLTPPVRLERPSSCATVSFPVAAKASTMTHARANPESNKGVRRGLGWSCAAIALLGLAAVFLGKLLPGPTPAAGQVAGGPTKDAGGERSPADRQ